MRLASLTAAAGLAFVASLALGCTERTAEERGAELFSDPRLSPSSQNFAACSTCHTPDVVPAGTWLAGGSLAGVAGRPSYFGGEVVELRDAVNFCLRFFMRHPDLEPLASDDQEGRDLLSYLETLGDSSPAVPFTIQRIVADDLPPGDATRGASVWSGGCRTCHGDKDTGANRASEVVSILPNETVTIHGDSARLATIEKVRHGMFFGAGGTMAPFSLEALPAQDLADVLAYLGY